MVRCRRYETTKHIQTKFVTFCLVLGFGQFGAGTCPSSGNIQGMLSICTEVIPPWWCPPQSQETGKLISPIPSVPHDRVRPRHMLGEYAGKSRFTPFLSFQRSEMYGENNFLTDLRHIGLHTTRQFAWKLKYNLIEYNTGCCYFKIHTQ